MAPESIPTAWWRLGEAQLCRLFSSTTLAAGRVYARNGAVQELSLAKDGATIDAITQGSRASPYRQTIRWLSRSGIGLPLVSRCSCPVGWSCKHLAAVLLVAAEELLPETPPVGAGPATPSIPRPSSALPPLVAQWLDSLPATDEAPSERSLRERLVYVLDVTTPARRAPGLTVTPFTQALRKDGMPGTARRYDPHRVETPARYLTATDKVILRRLARFARDPIVGLAADDEPEDLLRRVLATGRAYWASPDGSPLGEGTERPGGFAWQMTPEGDQLPQLQVDGAALGVAVPSPWYVDPATAEIGPIACAVPMALAISMLAAPPIPPESAGAVAAELRRRQPTLPAPLEVEAAEVLAGPPVRRLTLTATRIAQDPSWRYAFRREHLTDLPIARLHFGYGPFDLPPEVSAQPWRMTHDGRLYELRRDLRAESEAVGRLAREGLQYLPDIAPVRLGRAEAGDFVLARDSRGTGWLDVVLDLLPELAAEGREVTIAPDFPVQLVAPEGEVEARLRQGSGIDWFEFDLGVVVDGARVDLVPALVQLIAGSGGRDLVEHHPDDQPFLVPLPDGRLLTLPLDRLRPTLLMLVDLFAEGRFGADAQSLRFTRQDAAEIVALEETSGLAWQGGEALRALGRQVRAAAGTILPAPLPANFSGTLRPYQAEGVAWLQFLRAAGLGGVLADDMGLGKTVQTLAHLAIEQAAGRLDRPALLICPTSLIPNWTREAARFTPSLRVLPLQGPARKERFGEIAEHDLVLTTYPLLARDQAILAAQPWHAVILDEAQAIRNPKAEISRIVTRLEAGQRLCLTGTPLQNHLGELWALFDFLAPGFLGAESNFRKLYRTPIEKHGDAARQEALRRRVRPFLLRRSKEEVVRDLPPKTEMVEPVEMGAAQRAIYEGIRLAMHARVKAAISSRGLARSGIVILDALLKLRQACCDPRLVKVPAAQKAKAGSAKLERLLELLAVLVGEGRRVLVFSQFTTMLALIEARLRETGIPYLILTGETKDRETPVRRFQASEVPVFLVSLKAGGVGLNLTAADTVIHFDPWWNPAAEDQATDRAHRIGQDKPVFVHRLVTLQSIEEKMEVLKERKRALVATVLGGEGGGTLRITEAEVEELFAAM